MRALAMALFALAACDARRETTAQGAAPSASAASTSARAAPSTAPSSVPSASASTLSVDDLPDMKSAEVAISVASFGASNTLESCFEIVALAREVDVPEFTDWTNAPKGTTRLRERCEKAFADRKVLARCELDREALRKMFKSKDPPKAKFVSCALYVYTRADDAAMKDCLDLGGRWRVTPP